MRYTRIPLLLCAAVVGYAAACGVSTAAPNRFQDPLETAAVPLKGELTPETAPLIALARLPGGQRLVAAGLRGLVVWSDDAGKHWTQARVPVQSDLVALDFVSAKTGWATGQDGVILRTDDGGGTWRKQFDGNMARGVLPDEYRRRIAAGEGDLKPYLDEVVLNTKDGPDLPFLGVYFQDEQVGYAVGSFGVLVRTEDGGQTWKPWLDHIDNPNFLNLNDIREIGGNVYIVGEQGAVFRLDPARQRFQSISPQYKGSFFRIVGKGDTLLVVGLNGAAYRSVDGGRSWDETHTGLHSTLTSAALSPDGRRVVLASKNGQAIGTGDFGQTFYPLALRRPMLFSDVVAIDENRYLFAGYQGVVQQALPPAVTLSSEKR